jgi:REP element-mobilizing transposase RayT
LCGEDALTGHSYEHRRKWVEQRLLFLGTVFTIDVCAYAVMSNHTHVVLHVDKDNALELTDTEVLLRWQTLHKPTLLALRAIDQGVTMLSEAEQITLNDTIAVYRQRLYDISWFMRELNEFIAREANTEDECTGHFWEGRFKSQALLDEHALLACMAYVDLNPIRANLAQTLDTSHHTSIKRRINEAKQGYQPRTLMPFIANPTPERPQGLPFNFLDYLALVDNSGRLIRSDKRGSIDINNNPILIQLGLDESQWHALSLHFESTFNVAAGTQASLQRYQMHTQRKRKISTRLNL